SEQLLSSASSPAWSVCGALSIQSDSRFKSTRFEGLLPSVMEAIAVCDAAGEHVFAGTLRVIAARLHLLEKRPQQAIEILDSAEASILATRFSHLIADMAARLAEARLALGDAAGAEQRAHQSIEAAGSGHSIQPLA